MKRFIDIGKQTGNQDEGVKEFCFFDTQVGMFESFNGESCWKSADDFFDDFDGNDIVRYLKLIPTEFK